MRLVLSTFASEADAEAATRTLIGERLAACGTLLRGARSIFWWEGRIQEENEVMVLFKVPDPGYAAFVARLREIHPYQTPEIVALASADVDPAYEAWLESTCHAGQDFSQENDL